MDISHATVEGTNFIVSVLCNREFVYAFLILSGPQKVN